MTSRQQRNCKKAAIRRALLAWYRRSARDLPWRRARGPYRIWLSEIMLQQTRVDSVVGYYRRFLRAFPSVRALAAASEDAVLKQWEGLGYYSRARNLHEAARRIVHERGGRFPRTAEAWGKLPGVGRYTAGAIASIAFGQRVAAVDGNVQRVLARLYGLEGCIDEAATQNELWALADALVPPTAPGDFNQSLMELGARICTPTQPDCAHCPVRRWCEALAAGRQHTLPVRRPKKRIPHYHVVAGAIRKAGRYLLVKRPPDGMLGGLWEFPGGRLADGQSRRRFLADRISEKLGIDVEVGRRVGSVDHAYSHFRITLHLYRCEYVAGRCRTTTYPQAKWIPPAHFSRYPSPTAHLKVLDRLRD